LHVVGALARAHPNMVTMGKGLGAEHGSGAICAGIGVNAHIGKVHTKGWLDTASNPGRQRRTRSWGHNASEGCHSARGGMSFGRMTLNRRQSPLSQLVVFEKGRAICNRWRRPRSHYLIGYLIGFFFKGITRVVYDELGLYLNAVFFLIEQLLQLCGTLGPAVAQRALEKQWHPGMAAGLGIMQPIRRRFHRR